MTMHGRFKSPVQCRGIMAIKILVDEGPELRLRITGETHTSLHLLRSTSTPGTTLITPITSSDTPTSTHLSSTFVRPARRMH